MSVFLSQLQNTPQEEESISKLKSETLEATLLLLLVRGKYRNAVFLFVFWVRKSDICADKSMAVDVRS